jgi:hypothetical protein
MALLACLPLAVAADAQRTPQPPIVVEKDGHCIAPVDQIRRNHPDMLRHQRDSTVHAGVRGARVSLNACIDCHANRSNGSVLGSSENFCQGCHDFVAVRLDCFECHQATPAAGARAASAAGSSAVDLKVPPL